MCRLLEDKILTVLNRIFEEIGYLKYAASWDFTHSDILLNGHNKSNLEGKGYRALINSVISMMLFEIFNSEDNYIQPGLMVIDTPLHGFDEIEDQNDANRLKTNLYKYFINNSYYGQLIIADNLKDVPDFVLNEEGFNKIVFWKDASNPNLRYGFLESLNEGMKAKDGNKDEQYH